jgi:pimeloyl-ACP methyl ester carboxylesterase
MQLSSPTIPTSVEHAASRDHGHLGFIVLASIATGLGSGIVLDLLVFAGSRESVITGMALLSLGLGFAMLATVSSWRTSQAQSWAARPAALFGGGGLALALTGPSTHTVGLLGWVWPPLLLAIVVSIARAARRSLQNWSRRTLLYPALAILSLLALGGGYETIAGATATQSVPKTGHLYAVNGHSLYMNCVGRGTPTVVLFNGLGERASGWERIQADVAATTRVCTFDRAGEGLSGPGAGGQDGRELAADTHALLTAARESSPYVLAGHSVGGTYALVYAHEYPSEVAGVALLDSATPYQFDLPYYPSFYSMFRRVSGLFSTVARTGITRIAGLGTPGQIRADHDEFTELPTVFKQAQALKTLGSRPLVVLTAGRGQQAGWFAAQDKLALLSSSHTHRTVRGATHEALLDDATFARITGMAIKAVVIGARTGVNLTERT